MIGWNDATEITPIIGGSKISSYINLILGLIPSPVNIVVGVGEMCEWIEQVQRSTQALAYWDAAERVRTLNNWWLNKHASKT